MEILGVRRWLCNLDGGQQYEDFLRADAQAHSTDRTRSMNLDRPPAADCGWNFIREHEGFVPARPKRELTGLDPLAKFVPHDQDQSLRWSGQRGLAGSRYVQQCHASAISSRIIERQLQHLLPGSHHRYRHLRPHAAWCSVEQFSVGTNGPGSHDFYPARDFLSRARREIHSQGCMRR